MLLPVRIPLRTESCNKAGRSTNNLLMSSRQICSKRQLGVFPVLGVLFTGGLALSVGAAGRLDLKLGSMTCLYWHESPLEQLFFWNLKQ
jgi:hypothetical protein